MTSRAAITINRPREEVERLWQASEYRVQDAATTFKEAPGDRGTEIHVEIEQSRLGALSEKVRATPALAKAKDNLRLFKQVVETGEIARSDATPEGEAVERKFKQRPGQPLEESELQKAGA